MSSITVSKKQYSSFMDIGIIVILALIPLFVTFPYRVNIFLSWEGAYRISQGQLPFRDFGTPLGGAYWIIPAIFFKVFGPQLITLVKAQVFINILSGLAFRSILQSLGVRPSLRIICVLLFCLSYSFFNFWPWYNHSVIVYEMIAIALLMAAVTGSSKSNLKLLFSAFFVCLSLLTKQDGGGMAFLVCLTLAVYCAIADKTWKPLLVWFASFALILGLLVLWLSGYGFGYWFNHGQPPHSSRVSVFEIADEFLAASQWIKFYLLLIFVLVFARFRSSQALWSNKKEMLFLILTLAMLAEAAVFQITSYTPPDNNIFFHSFAFAYILYQMSVMLPASFQSRSVMLGCSLLVVLWWSGAVWKYLQPSVERIFPQHTEAVGPGGENLVNRNTYMIRSDTTTNPMTAWVNPVGLNVFSKIYMPQSTSDGITRLLQMDLVRKNKSLRVLNMSELTPLAAQIPFALEKNPELPLWYHLGVGMFNRQADIFESRIKQGYYDLVLFEYVPNLNNFYPFRVRDCLKSHYRLADSFAAPRRGDIMGTIEVYVK